MDFTFLMNLNDYVQQLPAFAAFLTAHWDSFVAVGAALVLMWQAVKKQQYSALWPLALQLVRDVAGKELSGVEKRKEVATALKEALPAFLQKVLTQEDMEKLAEDAYMFLRGELKQEAK